MIKNIYNYIHVVSHMDYICTMNFNSQLHSTEIGVYQGENVYIWFQDNNISKFRYISTHQIKHVCNFNIISSY